MSTDVPYGHNFYNNRRERTVESARRILGIVKDQIPFRTVADIGCGSGTWLAVALELGAERVFGLEGHWVTREMLDDPRINFFPSNLESRFSLPDRTDMAISLEVAEHLTPGRAETFVEDLCSIAPRILFSAAIPNQGGVNHLNERWQSFWANLFEELRYRPLDLIRPQIWTEGGIPVWYRQNTLLYVSEEVADELKTAERQTPAMLDVVHPDQWTKQTSEPPHRGRSHLAAIPAKAFKRALRIVNR